MVLGSMMTHTNSGALLKDGDMRSVLTFVLTLFVFTTSILDIVLKGGDGNPGEWVLGPWLMILTFYFQDKSHQRTSEATAKATAAAAATTPEQSTTITGAARVETIVKPPAPPVEPSGKDQQ